MEVEIRYGDQFRLRVRDDGKGMDAAVLSSHGLEGHYGLRGMRERARLIEGKLAVWSEVDEGTEVELRVSCRRRLHDRSQTFLVVAETCSEGMNQESISSATRLRGDSIGW